MKILFLDRDGVINIDHGFVSQISDFKFNDGIFSLCKKYIGKGYKIIIVTNQTGIGLGKYSLDDYHIVMNYMIEEFKKRGIDIFDIFFCPHSPYNNCNCRKPKPKMILDAMAKYDANPIDCILVGDKITDIMCGHNAGIEKIFFLKKNYPVQDLGYNYNVVSTLDEI